MDPESIVRIRIPKNLTFSESAAFLAALPLVHAGDHYVFDFSGLRWATPFCMLLVASAIRHFCTSRLPASCAVVGHTDSERSYFAHMGFFSAFGLNFGKKPGEAPGSTDYLPITRLKYSDIVNQAGSEARDPNLVLETSARKMAVLLTRQAKGDLVDTLEYALREIMRNVFEHSGAVELDYCAQYWPTKGRVEIAVCDLGCGIKAGLSRNPFLTLDSDRTALKYAILPGISGKFFQGVKPQSNNPWQNSGFGLFMLNQLGRDGGKFTLCSGGAAIRSSSDKPKEHFTTCFPGTAVSLELDTRKRGRISDRLNEYRVRGEKLAREHGIFTSMSASKVSSMLLDNSD